MKRTQQITEVQIRNFAGPFAEDKDKARAIRVESLMPALDRGDRVVLDFSGIDVATQSFVHALISEAIRSRGESALGSIEFRSCNPVVRNVVLTVIEYSLDSVMT